MPIHFKPETFIKILTQQQPQNNTNLFTYKKGSKKKKSAKHDLVEPASRSPNNQHRKMSDFYSPFLFFSFLIPHDQPTSFLSMWRSVVFLALSRPRNRILASFCHSPSETSTR
uniref:Uncharacterized protein n=1 Tax=Oryza brachyantha TaxID=4533 RepID=J3MNA5_ORYBR